MGLADSMVFFTAEDPREIPKGSRDPLRFLPEWTRVGREMIPGLTTVTPSYRGFLTRLLFHGALEKLDSPLVNARAEDQWRVFARFEFLCAVVRTRGRSTTPNLPGKTSVPADVHTGHFLIDCTKPSYLGTSQKNTGFWGYYQQASLAGELLELNKADQPGYRLTAASATFLDAGRISLWLERSRHQLEVLLDPDPKGGKLEVKLSDWEDLGFLFSIRPYVANNSGSEAVFWSERLLWPVAREAAAVSASPETVQALGRALKALVKEDAELSVERYWEGLADPKRGFDEAVRQHARKVCAAESVMGVSEWILEACRITEEGSANLKMLRERATKARLKEWLSRLREMDAPDSPLLIELRSVLIDGNIENIAKALIERHERIMKDRRLAPWVALEADDSLLIREPLARIEPLDMDGTWCPILWRRSFFLSAWISVARELGYLPEEV